jgi:hypothetical protein
VQPPAASITETKEAFNNILTVIQSAPSIELVSLTQYAEYFGEVPVSSPDGIRRGLVLYKANCQTSKMEVADARKVSAGYELAQLSPEYVRSSGLAAPLSGSLLTTESMAGLANIVADEMSMTEVEVAEDCTFNPKLFAIQVTDDDLMLLAMAKSEAVAYVKASVYVGPVQPTAPLQLLFGCTVSEQWRMSTFASTPLMAFFLDPAAVIVYKSAMTATLSKPMPSRPQSLGLIPASDMVYANLNESNIEEYLLRQVERPFTLKVPLQSLSGETVIIDLEIMVLAALLGYDPTTYPERSGAFYAAVREPGVDDETRMMLQIALAYALEGGNILGDKAKSWVIERLAPLMMHPAVQQLTTRSINASIIKQKLDARSMAPQFKELVLRSYFGVAMAILARFGKLDGDTAAELTRVLPITGLSVKSQLALAAMPHQLNASYLRDAT